MNAKILLPSGTLPTVDGFRDTLEFDTVRAVYIYIDGAKYAIKKPTEQDGPLRPGGLLLRERDGMCVAVAAAGAHNQVQLFTPGADS